MLIRPGVCPFCMQGDGAAGGDGDFDYEDEFSDDDGQLEFDPQDENEAKELEVRQPRPGLAVFSGMPLAG